MEEKFFLRGTLQGHFDMVTAIVVPTDGQARIVSSSRDKSLLIWDLEPVALSTHVLVEEGDSKSRPLGTPPRRLTGHSHYVQDVVLSSDSMFALSCSSDGDLRLWDLSTGATTRKFVGHNKDVLSVAFSSDNHQIMSASRDGTFKLWNTIGKCKCTVQEADAHNGWVSCVRFFPSLGTPLMVSSSSDHTIMVWNLTNCKLRHTMTGHIGDVNDVAVSPDGSLCASGGKYGVALLWDIEEGRHLYSLDVGPIIHALCFCPDKYLLCAATENNVQIWDLESKSIVQELKPDQPLSENKVLYCTSLNWSVDGNTFFTGYSDGTIRVWGTTSDCFTQDCQDLATLTRVVETRLSTDFSTNNLEIHIPEASGISSDSDASSESDDICVICQGEHDVDDFIVILDCKHMCHSDCIDDQSMVKNMCPKCTKVALSRDKRRLEKESKSFSL